MNVVLFRWQEPGCIKPTPIGIISPLETCLLHFLSPLPSDLFTSKSRTVFAIWGKAPPHTSKYGHGAGPLSLAWSSEVLFRPLTCLKAERSSLSPTMWAVSASILGPISSQKSSKSTWPPPADRHTQVGRQHAHAQVHNRVMSYQHMQGTWDDISIHSDFFWWPQWVRSSS